MGSDLGPVYWVMQLLYIVCKTYLQFVLGMHLSNAMDHIIGTCIILVTRLHGKVGQ